MSSYFLTSITPPEGHRNLTNLLCKGAPIDRTLSIEMVKKRAKTVYTIGKNPPKSFVVKLLVSTSLLYSDFSILVGKDTLFFMSRNLETLFCVTSNIATEKLETNVELFGNA